MMLMVILVGIFTLVRIFGIAININMAPLESFQEKESLQEIPSSIIGIIEFIFLGFSLWKLGRFCYAAILLVTSGGDPGETTQK